MLGLPVLALILMVQHALRAASSVLAICGTVVYVTGMLGMVTRPQKTIRGLR